MNVTMIRSDVSNAEEVYAVVAKEIELFEFEKILEMSFTTKKYNTQYGNILHFTDNSDPDEGYVRIFKEGIKDFEIAVEWEKSAITVIRINHPTVDIVRATMSLQVMYHIDDKEYEDWPLESATC